MQPQPHVQRDSIGYAGSRVQEIFDRLTRIRHTILKAIVLVMSLLHSLAFASQMQVVFYTYRRLSRP